jgi:Zn-finger nucleic acid-binding protein
MRLLVACPECHRQFDASGRPPGASFPCSCGAAVTVPQPQPHDAAVVRCSSCGAPREGEEAACRFCAAEFTLHEKDLDTICPGCMARVSGQARFCHHCGTPLLGGQAAAGESGYRCPSCTGDRPLASRRLGQSKVALFDCSSCGGLWLEKEIFEVLSERARAGHLPEGFGGGTPGEGGSGRSEGTPQPLRYRPCVICGTLMNRRNYGRKSGVIVDVCARHGIWFDLDELDRLLRWIREGGEARAEAMQREQERIELRQQKLGETLPPWNQPESERLLFTRHGHSISLASELASGLMSGVIRWFFD